MELDFYALCKKKNISGIFCQIFLDFFTVTSWKSKVHCIGLAEIFTFKKVAEV